MLDLDILAFTDFHGQRDAFSQARKLILSDRPDLVVVAGDLVNHDAEHAKQMLLQLAEANRPVYFVPGNMDAPALADWTGTEQVHPLHGRCLQVYEVSLLGLGGSPVGAFKFPFGFTEQHAATLLDNLAEDCHGDNMILVSHCPPRNTKIDRIHSGEHVGSISVREFVEKARPLLVISGHIHEAQGMDSIGVTTVVNIGAAEHGCFARISISDTVVTSFNRFV